jgi:hypothetical protein
MNRPAKADGAIVVADKNHNKNWNNKNKKVVVVRPYRAWNKQAYYGTVIGGVALGTILGAAATQPWRQRRISVGTGRTQQGHKATGTIADKGPRPSACSSTDRAPDFESGGCRFEPCQARQSVNGISLD